MTPLRSTHREYNQISNLKRQEKQKSSHSSQSSSHKSTIPPELPPRRNGTVYGSVWSKPLGNVETFFNRKSDAVAAGGKLDHSSHKIFSKLFCLTCRFFTIRNQWQR